MPRKLRLACVQMTSGPEVEKNLPQAVSMIREAARSGARFVATPENTCHIVSPGMAKLDTALPEREHPALPLFSSLAAELGIWLLIGSLSIRAREEGEKQQEQQAAQKLLNRSYLFSPEGKIAARYDKIHMFTAALPGGEKYREADVFRPGSREVVARTDFGTLGLSICYDVRFPGLYRRMAQAGAEILMVPAAFIVPTGKLHWEILLRARAIENGAFVVAPAQTGEHHGNRASYGHSLIVDPWGRIVAEAGEEKEILLADIDLGEVAAARTSIPSLQEE